MTSIILISAVLAAEYLNRFWRYISGWKNLPEEHSGNTQVSDTAGLEFSVIVAFRNEAGNLDSLISSLKHQTLPPNLFEVILVNDHSDDAGPKIILAELNEMTNLHMLDLPQGVNGKKQAVYYGIQHSNAPYIVTTDADCVPERSWLSEMYLFLKKNKPIMVSAPVAFTGGHTFFEAWQEMEFAGLIAIGAASIYNRKPNMCNGANLLYSKEAFYKVNGFSDNIHLLSGDDEFLMHKISVEYPGGVAFLKSKKALVYTKPAVGLSDFMHQRLRWISKSAYYSEKRITFQLLFSYLFIIQVPIYFVAGFFDYRFWYLGAAAFALKCLPEFFFFRLVLPFFGKSKLLRTFFVSELLHIAYISLIGILSVLVKFKWKGRAQ